MRKIWPWGIAAAVFIADRVTKLLAPRIPENGQVLIPGILGLRYAENKGIAFSLLSGVPWALGLLSLVIILAVFFFVRERKRRSVCFSFIATLCEVILPKGERCVHFDRYSIANQPV